MALNVEAADRVKAIVLADDYTGYGSPLWAQHGFSLLLEVEAEKDRKLILFDAASHHEPLLFNMSQLGISPSTISLIVLSHHHYDHTGGLLGLLQKMGGKEVSLTAHPEIFKQSFKLEPRLRFIGPKSERLREEAEALGGCWKLSRNPVKLFPGVVFTGEIERVTSFERETTLKAYTVKNGKIVRDRLEDDVSLAVNTRQGLLVFSACSHAGIINIVRKAKALTGAEKVKAVLGGFHLVDASTQRIKQTIKALKELNVENVYAGHCTGLKAECMLLSEFGENFRKLHCGFTVEF